MINPTRHEWLNFIERWVHVFAGIMWVGTTYYFMVATLGFASPAYLHFNLIQAPAPLTFSASVNKFGSVNPRTGTATISGTVTSSQQIFVDISGELKQVRGGVPISGFFSISVPCDAKTVRWSVSVESLGGIFHGRGAALFASGPATVTGTASAFDPDTGEFIARNISANITLRGRRP